MFENPKTGDVMVDFVTWVPDNSFAEFNVFKYSKRQGGGGEPFDSMFLKELGE
jgi:hypothetical protein